MKKTLFLAAFVVTTAHAQITNPSPYCAAGYDDGGGTNLPHYISNVTLGTLNNTSGTTQAPGQHYIYYNNMPAPQLKKGTSYPLSVSYDNGVTVHFVAAFIDFNHNNSFTDPGEMVLNKRFPSGTNPLTTNITIPSTALVGNTRMRVLVFEDDMFTSSGATSAVPCTTDATGSFDFGETEDYNVNIVAPTSVPELSLTEAMIFYPNPASGQITIKNELIGATVVITDLSGRTLATYASAPPSIDISKYAPGIYITKIMQDNELYVQKLIIR